VHIRILNYKFSKTSALNLPLLLKLKAESEAQKATYPEKLAALVFKPKKLIT
jgi:hypothetical protein